MLLHKSSIWETQRRWYEEHALSAWKTGQLPSWISSNAFVAAKYANLILSFARDTWSSSTATENFEQQPIHIVEVGAGSGNLGFLILKHLVNLREFWPASNCFRYVLTDFAPNIIEYWKNQENLRPFFDDGLLDYALFDCEGKGTISSTNSSEIHLVRTGVTLSRSTLRSPVIVVANYVFSSLRMDHVQIIKVDDERVIHGATLLKRAECTLSSPSTEREGEREGQGEEDGEREGEGELEVGSSDTKQGVAADDKDVVMSVFPKDSTIQFHHVLWSDLDEQVVLPYANIDANLSKIFQKEYVESPGENMSVCVPLGAIECVRRLHAMAADTDLLMLSGDKAFDQKSDYESHQPQNPHVAFHGSLSFMVNNHCLKEYVRELGGFTVDVPHRSTGFKVQGHVFGSRDRSQYRCFLRKWCV